MASNERNPAIDWLQYVALRVTSMFLHCRSVDANLRMAAGIGDLIYRLDVKHRDRALANLRRSFPHLSDAQRHDLARRSLRVIPMLGIDVLFTTRLIRLDTWTRYVDLSDNLRPVLELLLRRNQGLIMLTGHYGNFEILGYVLALLGFPTSSVARPLDNKPISDWLFGVRERMGQKIIGKKGATTEVTETLDRHGVVGFVADQNAGSKGIFVDFFGRKASTYKSIGLVAMQYDVPIVVGYARRIGERFRFRIGAQDIIWPDDWKQQDDPLRYITQRYTRAIEDFIRDDPSQYWWVHRRWKTRPKGEAPEAFD
jgi:Kdo2-lipid IVA lauroyltransferase/acyltransferase